MTKQTEALKQLIEDLISMMEYHVEQTRPIHTTTVALQAAKETLKALAQQSNEQVEPVASRHYFFEYVGFGKWAKCNKETYDKMPKMERLSVYTHPPVPTAQPKEPEQEPVAWMNDEMDCIFFDAERPEPFNFDFWKPLYTTPPQRKPLTDDEYFEIGQRHWLPSNKVEQIHKEIEAKLKEKNERLEKNNGT